MRCLGTFLVCVIVIHICGADQFEEDGILVTEMGATRTIEAIWTALVVINPPNEIPMRAWVSQVRDGIQAVGPHVTAADQRTWEARLRTLDLQAPRIMEPILDRPSRSLRVRSKRVKRGLLNIVGDISKTLFGTATDHDVSELRHIVAQTVDNDEVITHTIDKMVTVINQTRKYVKENRFDIQDLQKHQIALEKQLTNYGQHLSDLDIRVNKLAMARSIDGTITELELVAEEYKHQWVVFTQQKHELERGWLTENTLAIPELESILQRVQGWGYVTPIPEWYYENLHIEPLWMEGKRLVFRVDIPAAGRIHYLQYKLSYFPVAIDNDYIRRVKGLNKIAVNTDTGSVFYPKECFGEKPRLCMPSKEILTTTCEWGIVTNNSLDLCIIEISKRNSSSEVFPLGIGNFVVTPYQPLDLTLRCSGKTAVTKQIDKPTQIEIPGNCKLETKEWRIRGTKKGNNTLVKQFKSFSSHIAMNFTWPEAMKVETSKELRFTKCIEVPLLEIKHFKDGYVKVQVPDKQGFVPYLLVGIGIFVVIVIVVIIK